MRSVRSALSDLVPTAERVREREGWREGEGEREGGTEREIERIEVRERERESYRVVTVLRREQ
jgi:hypothetical protein